ncbi:MAG TPA: hypothetical protein VLI69_04945 [Gammaproteobacteria bacterium]|nr:hypothetical protein [Gammaproteobacteria bacterium]
MPKSRLQLFLKTSEIYELRGGLFVYRIPETKNVKSVKASPARLTVSHNIKLPSYEIINKSIREECVIEAGGLNKSPLQEVFHSVFLLYDHYEMYHWLIGAIILTFANLLQIIITTGIEFGFRTQSAILMQPINLLFNLTNNSDSSQRHKSLEKIGIFIIFSPLWCIAQFMALIADASAYSREWFDAGVHVFNPLELIYKAVEFTSQSPTNPVELSKPSLRVAAKAFALSTVDLLPSILIMTICLLAAGVSIPFLEASGIAGPLKSLGNTLFPSASSAGGVGAAAIWIYSSGMLAACSKVFTGSINTEVSFQTKKNDTKKQRSQKLKNLQEPEYRARSSSSKAIISHIEIPSRKPSSEVKTVTDRLSPRKMSETPKARETTKSLESKNSSTTSSFTDHRKNSSDASGHRKNSSDASSGHRKHSSSTLRNIPTLHAHPGITPPPSDLALTTPEQTGLDSRPSVS